MIQRQLKVMIATFPYGGVGASSLEVPDIRHWQTRTVLWMSKDKRIQPFDDWLPGRDSITISDTPISMCRNEAVRRAREQKADVLIWVDSDMRPDCELGVDPLARAFVPEAFDFLYKHWERGPTVLAAPYCGASPVNNVFVFEWDSDQNDREDRMVNLKLSQYSRTHAYKMAGIQPCAAIGTGLMMMDMRIFDLLPPPWFYYTYNPEQTKKLATEDCTFTRDVAMLGHLTLGYEPLLCTWNSWAGHWKPELVRKPQPMTLEMANEKYKRCIRDAVTIDERIVDKRDSYVIETEARLPDRDGGRVTGKAQWRMAGRRDGAVQIEGDFIDEEAKRRYIEEHGLAHMEARVAEVPVAKSRPKRKPAASAKRAQKPSRAKARPGGRKNVQAVPARVPVHKKVVRNRHNTLSKLPKGRSAVSSARSRRKAKA